MACLSQAYPSLTGLQTVADITHPIKADFSGVDTVTLNLSALVSGSDDSCDTTCTLEQVTDLPSMRHVDPADENNVNFDYLVDFTCPSG